MYKRSFNLNLTINFFISQVSIMQRHLPDQYCHLLPANPCDEDGWIRSTVVFDQLLIPINESGISSTNIDAYQVNAGNFRLFPNLLSGSTTGKTHYEFAELSVTYHPSSYAASTCYDNSAAVVLAVKYDKQDEPVSSILKLRSLPYSQKTHPCEGLTLPLESSPASYHPRLPIVIGPYSPAESTSHSTLLIGTSGILGDPNTILDLGQLLVTYRVRLTDSSHQPPPPASDLMFSGMFDSPFELLFDP